MDESTDQSWIREHPLEVLKRHGVWARRGLGQNFLASVRDLERVAEAPELSGDEVLLEIGTGLGRLTALLAARARRVVGVEIDDRLHAIAAENLADCANVELLRCDALESKHRINPAVTSAVRDATEEAEGKFKVVSNLPYRISSPVVVNMLEWELRPVELYLMLQDEVAGRMTAEPGTGDYGPLTVYVDYWATVERLFTLGSHAFWPAPEVNSAFLRLRRCKERHCTEDYTAFAELVRRLFTSRRKTLRKALKLATKGVPVDRVIEDTELLPAMRVEELSVSDFEKLTEAVGERSKP